VEGGRRKSRKLQKKDGDFPVPSRNVTNQTLPGREYLNYSPPGRVWLVTSLAGWGREVRNCKVFVWKGGILLVVDPTMPDSTSDWICSSCQTVRYCTILKGLCHEMTIFFEGLKYQIITFCMCADSF
jgi:hypothetical protein